MALKIVMTNDQQVHVKLTNKKNGKNAGTESPVYTEKAVP